MFTGVVQVGTNCGPQAMTWNMVVASPANEAFTAVVQVQTSTPEELETLLLTFNITPDATVPGSTIVPGSTTVPGPTSVPTSTSVSTSTTVAG